MYKYYVDSNQQLTPTTLLLTLKRYPSARIFSFQPGQYAAISFTHNGRPTPARCFSIASSPTDQSILQFSIRLKGRFTKALLDLKEGDKVNVRGPFGAFVLDADRDNNVVMIAGGIGIAPFMSMIQYAATIELSNKMKLIYSFSNQDDAPFVDQIIDFDKNNPNFKASFAVGNGPVDKFNGYEVSNGRITTEVINKIVENNYTNKSFFICGPPPFMNAMSKILFDKGVPHDNVMTEAFSQGPHHQTGKLRSWPNNIYMLGAVGVAIASLVIMVKDLLETLPTSGFSTPSSLVDNSNSTNSRQSELDKLVNELPAITTTAPSTDAAVSANAQTSAAASVGAKVSNAPTSAATTTVNPTPVVSKPVVTPTPTPKPTPTPTPAPYVPTCTTTQSGNTTCV